MHNFISVLATRSMFGIMFWQNLGFLSAFCISEILVSLSVIYHKWLWHCSVLDSCCHEHILNWHSGFDLREEKAYASWFFVFDFMSFLLQWISLGNKTLKTMSNPVPKEKIITAGSLEPWSWTWLVALPPSEWNPEHASSMSKESRTIQSHGPKGGLLENWSQIYSNVVPMLFAMKQ